MQRMRQMSSKTMPRLFWMCHNRGNPTRLGINLQIERHKSPFRRQLGCSVGRRDIVLKPHAKTRSRVGNWKDKRSVDFGITGWTFELYITDNYMYPGITVFTIDALSWHLAPINLQ
jgi:hypothetical protein